MSSGTSTTDKPFKWRLVLRASKLTMVMAVVIVTVVVARVYDGVERLNIGRA